MHFGNPYDMLTLLSEKLEHFLTYVELSRSMMAIWEMMAIKSTKSHTFNPKRAGEGESAPPTFLVIPPLVDIFSH